MLLKVRKRSTYYRSKYLFLVLLGSIVSLSAIAYPLFQNCVNSFAMFQRSITVQDIAAAFILHVAASIMGAAVAIAFQPMCMKDRKMALLFMTFVSIVGLIKDGIIQDVPAFRFILWIFPPLSNLVTLFDDCDSFSGISVLMAAGLGGIYSLLLIAAAQKIINKKLY